MKTFINVFLSAILLSLTFFSCEKDDGSSDNQSSTTVTDADGNVYNTVKIGTQTWMVENLKTTKYNDGTSIPNVTDQTTWNGLTSGAYCNYKNQENYVEAYGRLYNWYAVNTGILAPKGWHVPTDAEWSILENYLIANGYNYDGTVIGNKIAKSLSATTGWDDSTNEGTPGNNQSTNNKCGFTALPGGFFECYPPDTHIFSNDNYTGFWWSSSEYRNILAINREIFATSPYFEKDCFHKASGLSVRCVKDN
jgi:uncharacterized protein (TIGR02145 family)